MKPKEDAPEIEVGIIRIKKDASIKIIRQMEKFLGKHNLLIAWDAETHSFVVSDLDRFDKLMAKPKETKNELG